MEDQPSVFLAFGGPVIVLAIFLYRFRRRLSRGQKIVAFILVYILSFATGLIIVGSSNFAAHAQNLIMGVGAGLILPVIYFLAFSLISRRNPPPSIAVPAPSITQAAPPMAPQVDKSGQWNPIIIAAIIQAIGAVIVAIIAHSR